MNSTVSKRRATAPLWFGASLLVVLMLLLAACGGDTGTSGTGAAATDTPAATAPTATSVPTDTPVATNAVKVVNFGFDPDVITVKAGTTVTWTNTSVTPHTATSDTAGQFNLSLSPGARDSFKFTTAGTYTYHCSIHPQMQATVIVTA